MPNQRRHAFSLIEILTVVSILILLIALLLPSLQSAHSSGKQVVCVNNQHQIFIAYRTRLVDETRKATYAMHPSNWHGYLYSYVNRDWRLYICPETTFVPELAEGADPDDPDTPPPAPPADGFESLDDYKHKDGNTLRSLEEADTATLKLSVEQVAWALSIGKLGEGDRWPPGSNPPPPAWDGSDPNHFFLCRDDYGGGGGGDLDRQDVIIEIKKEPYATTVSYWIGGTSNRSHKIIKTSTGEIFAFPTPWHTPSVTGDPPGPPGDAGVIIINTGPIPGESGGGNAVFADSTATYGMNEKITDVKLRRSSKICLMDFEKQQINPGPSAVDDWSKYLEPGGLSFARHFNLVNAVRLDGSAEALLDPPTIDPSLGTEIQEEWWRLPE